MYETFKQEAELSTKKTYNSGKIEDRFQCSIQDVSLEKKYDLITGRWALCYLYDKILYSFLKRCIFKLIDGRSKDKPGIMIISDPIT